MCSNYEAHFYIRGNMWRTISHLKHEITVQPHTSEGSSNDDNNYDGPTRITIRSTNFHTKQHNFIQIYIFFKFQN